MSVGIRSQKYHDPMGKKRRRRFWFKRIFWGVVIVGVGFGLVVEVRHISGAVAHRFQKAAVAPLIRTPAGTWCRGDECRYFDRSGEVWGQALKSSGPLLLLVQDQRADDTTDPSLVSGIFAAVDGLTSLGIGARNITLPDAEPGGMTIVTTKNYDLYMDAQGDVPAQLAVLAVFLADRAKDPAFAPTYVDLRTPGRVYYK